MFETYRIKMDTDEKRIITLITITVNVKYWNGNVECWANKDIEEYWNHFMLCNLVYLTTYM